MPPSAAVFSLVGVSLLLGLMSKEEAFAVPLLAIAWALVLRPAGWRRALVISLLVMGISCAAVLALRSAFLTPSKLVYFPPDKPVWVALTMVRVAALYFELLLVPVRLCPFYDWFIIGFETGLSFAVALGAAGLCLALVNSGDARERRDLVVTAVARGTSPRARLFWRTIEPDRADTRPADRNSQ